MVLIEKANSVQREAKDLRVGLEKGNPGDSLNLASDILIF